VVELNCMTLLVLMYWSTSSIFVVTTSVNVKHFAPCVLEDLLWVLVCKPGVLDFYNDTYHSKKVWLGLSTSK